MAFFKIPYCEMYEFGSCKMDFMKVSCPTFNTSPILIHYLIDVLPACLNFPNNLSLGDLVPSPHPPKKPGIASYWRGGGGLGVPKTPTLLGGLLSPPPACISSTTCHWGGAYDAPPQPPKIHLTILLETCLPWSPVLPPFDTTCQTFTCRSKIFYYPLREDIISSGKPPNFS